MWGKGKRRQEDQLRAECEAFLAGTYAELMCRPGGPPLPVWTCLNAVAHRNRRRLERLAQAFAPRSFPFGLSSYLAREVLAAADSHGVPLESLQRSILIPLELELLYRSDWPTRRDIVEVIADLEHRLDAGIATSSLAARSKSTPEGGIRG